MIGVFDSGFGGITFLREFTNILPERDFAYLGDNAGAPYGNKSSETIYRHTRLGTEFLFSQGCQLVILACNTASAEALRRIQQELLPEKYPDKKVLGVLRPLAEGALQTIDYTPKKNKIGVIGSRATIQSDAYPKELKKMNPAVEVYSRATPLLVPLVEEGWIRRRETKMILRYYLRELKHIKINTLILGCTHYPVLEEIIRGVMGPQIKVLDGPQCVGLKLADYLKRHPEIDKGISRQRKRVFYTTDDHNRFESLGQRFYKNPIPKAERVDLAP